MVMKINSENIDNIILYFTTNRSAENIISNVPVLALGYSIVQFKTDLFN